MFATAFVDGAAIIPTTATIAAIALVILLPLNYYLRWFCWYNGGRKAGEPSPDQEFKGTARAYGERMK